MLDKKILYIAAMMMSLSACTTAPKSAPVKSNVSQTPVVPAQPAPTPVEYYGGNHHSAVSIPGQ